MTGGALGQITTSVPVNIYEAPDPNSAIVGTFMPGLVMVDAAQVVQPYSGRWHQVQEAVLDLSQPDTAIVNTIGWVSEAEASAAGGAIAGTTHVPPYETPWPGSGIVTTMGTVISGATSAVGAIAAGTGSTLLVLGVIAVAAYMLIGRPTVVIQRR